MLYENILPIRISELGNIINKSIGGLELALVDKSQCQASCRYRLCDRSEVVDAVRFDKLGIRLVSESPVREHLPFTALLYIADDTPGKHLAPNSFLRLYRY